MTRLFNAPQDFADEMLEGFVAAHSGTVQAVPGGVVRSTERAAGKVAVVIGGGSGHYPAFCGLVGPGMADGAAMGDLFASPSAQRVLSVARAADNGAGVLLTYGNYAGDVLNFDSAQEQLNASGTTCRTVVVTDDVASAPSSQREKRRGIAGDLAVFKVACAAAEQGYSLTEVQRVTSRANDRTRSFGVAFSGCTLPGATGPLFTVAAGRMAVGLGIHGEPGIDETEVPTANGLAELLVTRLLDELPDDIDNPQGQRVTPILNGLGSVKYEELFVVFRSIASLLADAGVVIVEPEVGELVTSFDMAGVSLSLFWLDDELELLWGAPASSPAYRKGQTATAKARPTVAQAATAGQDIPQSTAESRAVANLLASAFAVVSAVVADNVDELGKLDAIAGDGDHGIGMDRGARAALAAVRAAVESGAGAGTALALAGAAWSDKAGGTSGALWGGALGAAARVLGDQEHPNSESVSSAISAAVEAVAKMGKAEVGDKTMIDAMAPFAATYVAAIDDGAVGIDAWRRAAIAAHDAAAGTADLLPRKGRARPHAHKSLGTPDPGAYSFALVVAALASSGDTVGRQS